MDLVFDGIPSLLGDFVIQISVILVLGGCLATLVGRSLLRRSNSSAGNYVSTTFLPKIWNSAGRPSSNKLEHRDVLGQLSDRLPSADPTGREQDPTIVDLLSQIVDVNATLHTRLENAEGTLENQAEEISTYKSEARTDVLTGLANRRVFEELLRHRVNAWQRDQTPVFVLLVDIDYFKRFNDSYGHQAGDEVLTQVAQLLRESMSEDDLVSRIGGEEFAVIIDGDCLQSALQSAEYARREIEQANFIYKNQHLHVTVSIGVADSRATENKSALVKRADIALYMSKSTGRNNVHWHNGKRSILFAPRQATVDPASGFSTTGVAALTETKDFSTVCNELRQRLVAVASEEC